MKHLEHRHVITLAGPLERVFPLFTPRGEIDWVPDWSPQFLYPADGVPVEGMVFRTGAGEEVTLWACADWQPAAHRVRYARVTPASRFGFVEVTCGALDPARTQASVAYAFTALSEVGEAYLESLTAEAFVSMIEGWRESIDAFLGAPAVAA